MGRKWLTTWVLAGLGLVIAVVAGASWALFPEWEKTLQGGVALVAVSALGAVTFVKHVVDIVKDVRELREGGKEERTSPCGAPLDWCSASGGGGGRAGHE